MANSLPNILSGDGMSSESAIPFEPCRLADRVAAEHEFICSIYGTENIHWTEEMHFTSLEGQSVWSISSDDETRLNVFFETEGTISDQ